MTTPTDDSQDQPETAALSASSQEALARGELPLEARRRLSQETGGRRFFASDLSVDELLLVEAQGYEPLGLVLGSSIYHVGWQYTYGSNWRSSYLQISQELETVTAAHLHARELAMGRMEQEASALGAHGVVGVRFTIQPYEGQSDLLEFTAIGTAVRLRGAPSPAAPFMSDLSGEDFWALIQAGYLPLGLAMGFSSYYVLPGSWPYVSGTLFNYGNQEMSLFSDALYRARDLAMGRLRHDLQRLGAEGVTAVRTDVRRQLGSRESGNTHYLSLKADFFVMGTAIRRSGRAVAIPTPQLLLNMTGLRPVRASAGAVPPELRLEG